MVPVVSIPDPPPPRAHARSAFKQQLSEHGFVREPPEVVGGAATAQRHDGKKHASQQLRHPHRPRSVRSGRSESPDAVDLFDDQSSSSSSEESADDRERPLDDDKPNPHSAPTSSPCLFFHPGHQPGRPSAFASRSQMAAAPSSATTAQRAPPRPRRHCGRRGSDGDGDGDDNSSLRRRPQPPAERPLAPRERPASWKITGVSECHLRLRLSRLRRGSSLPREG